MFLSKLTPLALLLASLIVSTAAVAPPPHSKCTNPSKRREWRTLSRKEKTEWTRAVKCLAQQPHNPNLKKFSYELNLQINASSSFYDDMVFIHLDNNNNVHLTGRFLPWHRWYVHVYEQALKTKCGYKGASPYWDWTQDASDFLNASIWKEADPNYGLGGWGDAADDHTVKDGAFGESSSFRLAYPIPHVLRRNYTLYPYTTFDIPGIIPDLNIQANTTFTKEKIDTLVASYRGDFKGFQADFEFLAGSHSSVHYITGGDFGGQCPGGTEAAGSCKSGPYFTANEPMFWLHHSMVDKVWFDWQNKHPENKNAFFGGSTIRLFPASEYFKYPNGAEPWLTMDDVLPANGLFEETTIGRMMDTTSGDLCYIYV